MSGSPDGFGGRLRSLREHRAYTQTRLAERAACEAPNISRMESGSRMPSLPVLRRITLALGLSGFELHWLVCGDPE